MGIYVWSSVIQFLSSIIQLTELSSFVYSFKFQKNIQMKKNDYSIKKLFYQLIKNLKQFFHLQKF